MTMGYPDTFKESFYESGCIIQQCCIIAPFFDTSPAIPPDKCLVVYSTSLSCPCRQASNAVGPTITVTNRGSFVGLVNSTLFSTSVVGFWGRELHTVEWKQWKEMWWNGKTLFSCMFIFSRDFSHPRQKISAKWQPFSTSKVHFKHSPIRQKNYKMSNTFLQNFKVCDINLLPPCNTLHLQKWVFFGGFWQPPTGSPKKKKNLRFNERLRSNGPTWLHNFGDVPVQLACCQLRIPSQPISNSRPRRHQLLRLMEWKVVVDGEIHQGSEKSLVFEMVGGWTGCYEWNSCAVCQICSENFPKVFGWNFKKSLKAHHLAMFVLLGFNKNDLNLVNF